MYENGQGVKQDHKEAVEWYRKAGKAAEQGGAGAQFNLGGMYMIGAGVPQDFATALKWLQLAELAAQQGYENALQILNMMQQRNDIPTPPPGTAVTAILLSSSKAAKLNKTGISNIKVNRVVYDKESLVLLDPFVNLDLRFGAHPIVS
eukprot:gene17361-biopygen6508